MKERIHNSVAAILAAEQKERKILVGDCPPGLEVKLNDYIDSLASILESIVSAQEERP